MSSYPHHQKNKRKWYLRHHHCCKDWTKEDKEWSLEAVAWCLRVASVASLSSIRQGKLPPCLAGLYQQMEKVCCMCTATAHSYLFWGSDKELEEIHTLPLGVQQRGDLLFQSLTGTLFFFLSSFGSHLCFCYYIILFFFNKKVRMGFEQKQILVENGPESFLTFVLKVHFGVVIKGPH